MDINVNGNIEMKNKIVSIASLKVAILFIDSKCIPEK